MRLRTVAICCVLSFLAAAPANADRTEEAVLRPSDGGAGGLFGWSIATSGDTAVIGSPSATQGSPGSAYVFERSAGAWRETAVLRSSTPDQNLRDFGRGVAIGGDTALVVAREEAYAASVYVFRRSGTQWIQEARLVAGSPLTSCLGGLGSRALAIRGDTIVIGDTCEGAAFVFERRGRKWTLASRLASPYGDWRSYFGETVAIWDETIVVGARYAEASFGAAHVYSRSLAGWVHTTKIIEPVRESKGFGAAVAVSDDTLAIGSLDGEKAGAYFYSRTGAGWVFQSKLSRVSGWGHPGASIDLSGDEAVGGPWFQAQRHGNTWEYRGIYWPSTGSLRLDVSPKLAGGQALIGGRDESGSNVVYVFSTGDSTPPDVTLWSGPPPRSPNGNAAFWLSARDSFASVDEWLTYTCSLDGASFTLCSANVSYAGLEDGAHTFRGRVADPFGNVTQVEHSWIVDTTPPDTVITGHPVDPSPSHVSFSFDTNPHEDAAYFDCSLDGLGWRRCDSPTAYGPLRSGQHTLEVVATDAAGIRDPTPARFTWTVDGPPDQPPETMLTNVPGDPSSANVTFGFRGEDDSGEVTRFHCMVDGGHRYNGSCSSPFSFDGLGGGTHTFSVRAIDVFGAWDPTPAAYSWRVDDRGPDVDIATTDGAVVVVVENVFATPLSGTATDDSAVDRVVVTFTSSTGEVLERNAVCISAKSTCSWAVEPPAATGRWTVTVRAYDSVGNEGPPTQPIEVFVLAL